MNAKDNLDSINSACQRIRKHINAPMKRRQLVNTGLAWLQICSSLDVVEDSELAITAYSEIDLSISDYGSQYLSTYGLLQALVIQQDAVRHLTEYLGAPFNPTKNPTLKRVRDVRNSVAGHPSKEDRSGSRSHNFLTRMTLSAGELTYVRARWDGDSEWATIKPLELIASQETELSQRLLDLVSNLDMERQQHIERHRGTRVTTHLGNLGYYFEKMSEHALGIRDTGALGLAAVADAINAFKESVTNRDGDLEAFAYLVSELNQADYCTEQLEKYFRDDTSGEIVSSMMATIVVAHLNRTVAELISIARDMDEAYNKGDVEGMES